MKYAKGTKLSWNGQDVARLNSIGGIEVSVDSNDITTHTLETRWKEWAAGAVDAGSVPISGYFEESDTTGQQAMYADAVAGETRAAVITGPGGAYTMTFSAFITNIKLIGDAPVDGWVPFSATLKVSGEPTLGISSSTGLTELTVSDSGEITPSFSGSVYRYAITFPTATTTFTLTPTAATHTIKITANGATQPVNTGATSSAITLGDAGSVIEVVIEAAQTGKAAKVYKFLAIRE